MLKPLAKLEIDKTVEGILVRLALALPHSVRRKLLIYNVTRNSSIFFAMPVLILAVLQRSYVDKGVLARIDAGQIHWLGYVGIARGLRNGKLFTLLSLSMYSSLFISRSVYFNYFIICH